MPKYNVTVEALTRAIVEVEAANEEDATAKVNQKLADEGIGFIEFDEMFDSVKVTNAVAQ